MDLELCLQVKETLDYMDVAERAMNSCHQIWSPFCDQNNLNNFGKILGAAVHAILSEMKKHSLRLRKILVCVLVLIFIRHK